MFGRRILWVGTATGTTALALGGFVLSFSALRDLAIASGIEADHAFIWPLIVDGFIVVTTAAAYALKERTGLAWYPWSALIVFSVISVSGNALHAADVADTMRVPLLVAAIVSAVPAVALLVSSHLLVVMAGSTGKPFAVPAPALQGQVIPAAEPVAELFPAENVASPLEHLAAAEGLRTLNPSAPAPDRAENSLLLEVKKAIGGGIPVTGAFVGRLQGVSARTGQRRLDDLKRTHPEIFASVAPRSEVTA